MQLLTLKIERSKDMSNHKQKVGNQTPTQSVIAPYQKKLSDEPLSFTSAPGYHVTNGKRTC